MTIIESPRVWCCSCSLIPLHLGFLWQCLLVLYSQTGSSGFGDYFLLEFLYIDFTISFVYFLLEKLLLALRFQNYVSIGLHRS